jgi:hypothetical protein
MACELRQEQISLTPPGSLYHGDPLHERNPGMKTAIKRYIGLQTGFSLHFSLLPLFLFLFTFLSSPAFSETLNDSIPGPPPGRYKILSEDGSIRIPFELHRGDIRMVCKLNGRKVRMLIDNGYLWDQLLLFGSPAIDSIGLEYEGDVDVTGAEKENPIKSKYAEGITLSYDDVEFYEQTAIVTPYSSGVSRMWTGAEGQVSATFFKHFAVRFDFDEMVMTLTPTDEFEYTGSGVEVPIEHLNNNSWALPATLEMMDGRRIKTGLMMDLGYGSWLRLVEGGPHRFTRPAGSIPGSLGFGIEGETKGYFGRIKSIEAGGYHIENVITAFAPEEAVGKLSETLLGMAFLSNFNFTYDYQNRRLFLEPNSNFNSPSEYNMSGLDMRKGAGDYLEVIRVLPGSPADEKGILVGDHVITIDGRPAVSYDVWELRPVLRRDGETVTLTISRDGAESEVSLVLRRLI